MNANDAMPGSVRGAGWMSMMSDANGVTFYFGAASGSARKALRQMEEPNVMINYATQNNTPWGGIEQLFIDSGGYSFMKGKGEYETSDQTYCDFIERQEPELWAFRDYPCEPDILDAHDRTVSDHQQMTVDRHRSLLDKYESQSLPGTPISVLQGWGVDDYIQHIDAHSDAGTLLDHIGIGSVCRRDQDTELRQIITSVADNLPKRVKSLHAFGVKANVLRFADVRTALTSADSQSYDFRARWDRLTGDSAGAQWHDNVFHYLKQKRQINALLDGSGTDAETEQQTLTEVGA